MSNERRTIDRCPVCQGPMRPATATSEAKCRTSTCTHNHQHAECPRCGQKDLAHVSYKAGKFHYSCADCQNNWQVDG